MLFLIIFALPSVNIGQEQKKIESVLTDASTRSAVPLDETAKSQILQQYKNASNDTKKFINSAAPESLKKSVENYFEVKKGTAIQNVLTKKDVSDFTWDYVSNKTDLVSVTINPSTAATITKITTQDLSAHYNNMELEGKKDTKVVIPKSDSFSIYASTAKGNLIWTTTTGIPPSGKIILLPPLSRGCAIKVSSEPDSATVYFNDKEYYLRTNTSSVREPGKWKVTIKKGNLCWEAEKAVEKGETWEIGARLTNCR